MRTPTGALRGRGYGFTQDDAYRALPVSCQKKKGTRKKKNKRLYCLQDEGRMMDDMPYLLQVVEGGNGTTLGGTGTQDQAGNLFPFVS